MRIRKFNEADLKDISSDRVDEVKESMSDMCYDINQKVEVIDSLINELNNFRSSSGKSIDQIDDTISNLQLIRKNLSESVDKLDNVVNSLDDYNKNGRNMIY